MDAISQEVPDAKVKPIAIATTDGPQVVFPSTQIPAGAQQVVSDYWVPVPEAPGTVALIRFWRRGPGTGADLTAIHEEMASAFAFIFPSFWSGPNRPFALKTYAPPAAGAQADEDGSRLAGVRLSNIFHTEVLSTRTAAAVAQSGARKTELLMILVTFLAWIGAMLALVGFEDGLFLGGGIACHGFDGFSAEVQVASGRRPRPHPRRPLRHWTRHGRPLTGVPHFIDGYSATRDVCVRQALPVRAACLP